MTGWESLRVDLLRYHEQTPGAVVMGPSPYTERRYEKRFHIELAAWATGIAEELQTKYGDLVDLWVGALTYPGKQLASGRRVLELRGEPAETVGLTAEPSSPLTIRSGHFATPDVLVTNTTAHQQTLLTAGDLRSAVTNTSGAVVGRYIGAHTLPRVEFPIDPHQTRPVPCLIGTASQVPDLGYAVPPGQWSLVISLHTAAGFYLSTPLDLTITP